MTGRKAVDSQNGPKTGVPPRPGERLLLQIVDSVGEGVWLVDADGVTTFVNERMRVMLGRPEDAILGRPLDALLDFGESRPVAAQWPAWRDGGDTRRELRLVRPDGSGIWTLIRSSPLGDAEGQPGGMLLLVSDISERRRAEQLSSESEQRFRKIADSVPGILWVTDGDGRFTYLSKGFEAYTGQPAESYYGLTTTSTAHPDDTASTLRPFEAAMRERRRIAYEYRVRGRDGTYRWFLDTCVPRHDEDGRFLGYIGMLIDVDDSRTLSEQLHQAQKMEAVGQLTGGVAHDFNNLLTVILGNAELMGSMSTDTRMRGLAEATMAAAERSAALVQRLLAFSRRQALQPQPTDIAALVLGLEDLLRRSLGEDIDIRFACDASRPAVVVDPGQLESAILNLALNARDAMPSGGRLTIETMAVQIDDSAAAETLEIAPGEYVLLAVSDTGDGMSEHTRRHAFDPFFTTKDVGKGSGLGLSMVYGFIKQSGGHVTLYSESGHGTTIKMYLPVAGRPALAGAAEDPAARPISGGSETILLVEDEPSVRGYVADQLRSFGYRVLEAGNGPAALAVLERAPEVALLLTDVVMPGGMNGRQLAEAARQSRPGLRVLYTTGYTENAIVHHGRLDADVDLLGKPFSRAALAAKVRTLLDRPG